MRGFAAFVLRLIGWRTVYTLPPGPKSVVIVYPHTSNWDFPIGMLFKMRHSVDLHWAGKDTLFRGPMGWFFRNIGWKALVGGVAGLVILWLSHTLMGRAVYLMI